MESHLHTLHLVKCNNEHKIIKRRVKAICRKLYHWRLELERKRVCMGKVSLLLKVHTRTHTIQGVHHQRKSCSASVFARLCLFSIRGIVHRDSYGYPGIAQSLSSLSSLNLIHKLLGGDALSWWENWARTGWYSVYGFMVYRPEVGTQFFILSKHLILTLISPN